MTEKELMEALIEYAQANDEGGALDKDGHYAFAVTGFVRPDNPEDWVECHTPADKKATVGSVSFFVGCGTEGAPPVEQVCARAQVMFTAQRLQDLISEAQRAIRKREETLQ